MADESNHARHIQLKRALTRFENLDVKLRHWLDDPARDHLVDKQYAADIAGLWRLLLSFDRTAADYAAPDDVTSHHWLEPDKLHTVSELAHSLTEMLDQGELNRDTWAAWVHLLREQLIDSLARAQDWPFTRLREEEWVELRDEAKRLQIALFDHEESRLTRLTDRAQDAAHRTENAANAAETAAGKTGDVVMSSFYAKLSAAEAESANKFRTLTVAFAMAAGTAALIFVLLPAGMFPAFEVASGEIARLIQKAIFVAGIFGIAGYFARQAHQHRSMANWAESLSVQLQTFDAYLAAIDSSEVKDELRKSFAARAFGDHPAMKGEPTVTPSAAAMDTAVGWAAKLTAGGK